ncbi:anti-anti-sigma factor [Actinoplanes tereljensis]|uniref:STAS domain-containing protein n=1 Tax=Paractinoplanes tereljensis TaxID=571912 RepID=UPI0019440CC6|nr:STAS domain-containing protein [Actinoplanes tereljensis]
MNLAITSRSTATSVRLNVSGEIDLDTAGQLDDAIAAVLGTGADRLEVDLSGTTFCSCAGITALLNGRREAVARQVGFEVVNATGIPLRVLQLTGVSSLLTTRSHRPPRRPVEAA